MQCFLERRLLNLENLLKRVTFNVGDPVFTRDFRSGQSWTAGTVAGRRESVPYEIQENNEIWIRHRNQRKHGHVENLTALSMPWNLLLDTFRLTIQENLKRRKAHESNGHNDLREPESIREDCKWTRT